jgi:lipopolysaccharide export LptBFGC system permease protein LptF
LCRTKSNEVIQLRETILSTKEELDNLSETIEDTRLDYQDLTNEKEKLAQKLLEVQRDLNLVSSLIMLCLVGLVALSPPSNSQGVIPIRTIISTGFYFQTFFVFLKTFTNFS